MSTINPIKWTECYDVGWKGFITPASFAHPAKFARGLIERIFDHCLSRGYLKKGDVIGDCFGGIGTGGIIASYRGLEWVGCELESKFHRLAGGWDCPGVTASLWIRFQHRWTRLPTFQVLCPGCQAGLKYEQESGCVPNQEAHRFIGNFDLHREKLKTMGLPFPRITQGDSRQFHLLVGGSDDGITSPPFTQGYQSGGGINKNGYGPDGKDKVGSRTYQGTGADRTAGNIETLKEGSVSGVISSPPYAVISTGAGGLNTKPTKHPGQQSGRSANAASQDTDQKYGHAEGQIAALKEGSVNGVISSPPWEKNAEGSRKGSKMGSPEKILACSRGHGASDAAVLAQAARDEQKIYGDSPGQIGKEAGETYWQAMDAVYRSCYQAIKPGGVIVLVVKDYVKGGKRVPLCDDTLRLIEHIGFTMIERIHAILVKETRHGDLFTGETKDTKSRKSFFRRLAEKKGSPAIDYEEVLIARRP